jgi:hypothetical protein
MSKRTLVWLATVGTMATMVVIWASVLPTTLEVESSNSDSIELTENINTTLDQLQKSFESIDGNVLGQTSTAENVENNQSDKRLTDEQLEFIKQELIENKTE